MRRQGPSGYQNCQGTAFNSKLSYVLFSKIIENSRGHIGMHIRSLGLTFKRHVRSKPSSVEDAFESAVACQLPAVCPQLYNLLNGGDQIPAVIKSLFAFSINF